MRLMSISRYNFIEKYKKNYIKQWKQIMNDIEYRGISKYEQYGILNYSYINKYKVVSKYNSKFDTSLEGFTKYWINYQHLYD